MIQESQWDRFFANLAKRGTIKEACEAADINRCTAHAYINGDVPEGFDHRAWMARYKLAESEAADVIEQEMFRRAVEGVDEPLIGRIGKDQDGVVTTVKKYSDALLVRLAQARRPEKFKDKVAQEVSGPGGGPIRTENRVITLPTIPEGAPE